MKWEYYTIHATHDGKEWGINWSDSPRESLDKFLDRYGSHRWELVSTLPVNIHASMQGTKLLLILKRQI